MVETHQTFQGIAFVGTGSSLPAQTLTNDQLGLRVETNDQWIRSRTGIEKRRISSSGETLTSLASQAALKALEMAGWDPKSLDLVILATSTPEDLFGSAPQVQGKIGASNAVAFDLTAACSGFLFALISAAQFLRNGAMKRALVIGADQLTRWVDWDDRRSCVLFGDGAGALLMEASSIKPNDLLGFRLKSDGTRGDSLNLPEIEETLPIIQGINHRKGGYSTIQMNGQEVYKFAVREVPLILEELLAATKTSPDSLDWLLLHQANKRILDAVADRFSIPYGKVLSNLDSYGNTSAATIPLMLDEAVRDGKVSPGDLIASSGFGAGLSWGAALFRWHGPN